MGAARRVLRAALACALLGTAAGWTGLSACTRALPIRASVAPASIHAAAAADPPPAAPAAPRSARKAVAATAPPSSSGAGGGSTWLRGPNEIDDSKRRESELESWLSSNGVYLASTSSWGMAPHPLGIATQTKDQDMQPSGRGLLATRGVRSGDALFRVPEKVCITRRNAAAVLGADVASDSLGEHETLALLLMRERALGTDSFWAPYINVLPRSADEVSGSFVWTEAELKMLQGSAALNEAREFKKVKRARGAVAARRCTCAAKSWPWPWGWCSSCRRLLAWWLLFRGGRGAACGRAWDGLGGRARRGW